MDRLTIDIVAPAPTLVSAQFVGACMIVAEFSSVIAVTADTPILQDATLAKLGSGKLL